MNEIGCELVVLRLPFQIQTSQFRPPQMVALRQRLVVSSFFAVFFQIDLARKYALFFFIFYFLYGVYLHVGN